MATHSGVLAWRIPWTEEPGGLPWWGRKESDTTERLTQQAALPVAGHQLHDHSLETEGLGSVAKPPALGALRAPLVGSGPREHTSFPPPSGQVVPLCSGRGQAKARSSLTGLCT